MIPSTILGLSELLNGSSMLHPVENANSDGTGVIETVNTSQAILADNTLYFQNSASIVPKCQIIDLESNPHTALSNTY